MLKYIFIKLMQMLKWLWKNICIISKKIYKFFKFIFETIAVIIVTTIYGIFTLLYVFIAYPFRILIIENKDIAKNKNVLLFKRLIANPYYIFNNILLKNKNQEIKIKDYKQEFTIFIQIKNLLALLPTFIYIILLYPINIVLIFILNPILK